MMKLSPSSMVDNMPKLLRKLSLTIQHQTKFGKPNGLRLKLSASFDDEDIEHILKLPLTKGLFCWQIHSDTPGSVVVAPVSELVKTNFKKIVIFYQKHFTNKK